MTNKSIESSNEQVVFILYLGNKIISVYSDQNNAIHSYREAQKINPNVKLDSAVVNTHELPMVSLQ